MNREIAEPHLPVPLDTALAASDVTLSRVAGEDSSRSVALKPQPFSYLTSGFQDGAYWNPYVILQACDALQRNRQVAKNFYITQLL